MEGAYFDTMIVATGLENGANYGIPLTTDLLSSASKPLFENGAK